MYVRSLRCLPDPLFLCSRSSLTDYVVSSTCLAVNRLVVQQVVKARRISTFIELYWPFREKRHSTHWTVRTHYIFRCRKYVPSRVNLSGNNSKEAAPWQRSNHRYVDPTAFVFFCNGIHTRKQSTTHTEIQVSSTWCRSSWKNFIVASVLLSPV